MIFLYFLFQFANLYDCFEIYQNYTTTVVAHGDWRAFTTVRVPLIHGG
jgi:hypothetical protein